MKISTLLFLCALALSGVAAYYSIVGLATIFSASFYAVVLMAGVLEVSKLVCASWLYQKWDNINSLIKVYLTSAVVVLMLITSLGIFGFLSRAHVDQKLGNTEVTLKIEQIDSQIASTKEVMDRYRSQLAQLDRAINIQLDANRATQALAARQRQVAERDQIRQKLDSEQQSLQKLEQVKTDLRQTISILESEVGPIKYVAEFFVGTGSVDVEKAVRWMILVIVLVFDPLAVLMLIAANMSYMKETKRKDPAITDQHNNSAQATTVQPNVHADSHLAGMINLKYDFKNRSLMYFNGQDWIPTELGMLSKNKQAEFTPEMLLALELSVTKAIENSRKINDNSTIDLQQIQKTVKAAMDAWLTTTSNTLQSRDNEDDEEPVSESNVNITDVEVTVVPASENNVFVETTTVIQPNGKPVSWI